VWASLFALSAVARDALIVAGVDDPVIPVLTAHIMNASLPHSRPHLPSGGHIDPVRNPAELAPVVGTLLREPGKHP
jgi:pimeloyl-ACP methyl ester carboxylesterase